MPKSLPIANGVSLHFDDLSNANCYAQYKTMLLSDFLALLADAGDSIETEMMANALMIARDMATEIRGIFEISERSGVSHG